MNHRFDLRVYYEDTDHGGAVYYANYFRFIERARTEFIRTLGVDQSSLQAVDGLLFVVRQVSADFLVPARFDDVLTITTRPLSVSAARIRLEQSTLRGDELLFRATLMLACINTAGRPTRIPAAILSAMET